MDDLMFWSALLVVVASVVAALCALLLPERTRDIPPVSPETLRDRFAADDPEWHAYTVRTRDAEEDLRRRLRGW